MIELFYPLGSRQSYYKKQTSKIHRSDPFYTDLSSKIAKIYFALDKFVSEQENKATKQRIRKQLREGSEAIALSVHIDSSVSAFWALRCRIAHWTTQTLLIHCFKQE